MKHLKNCTVTLMVSNLDLAIGFYTDTLGLILKVRYGEHYAEIAGPGLLLGLHPTDTEIKTGNNMSVGFGVSSFDETVSTLTEKGLALKVKQDGPIRLGHFADPDGNPLFLAEISDYE